ncbi:MAG: Na+/H+ antiporter subunit B, partial [Thermodesulfobacteriota bacterium]
IGVYSLVKFRIRAQPPVLPAPGPPDGSGDKPPVAPISLILSTAIVYLLPLLLLLSVFLLLHGHNLPGGGFVGGLVASAAFALYAIARGVGEARRILRADPKKLIALGLFLAAFSGLIGVFSGAPFMTSLWTSLAIPVEGDAGTPLIFDAGVYLVVLGVALTVIFSLAEE